jgi:hypothetical protein
MTNPNNNPKKQSLKEWAMAGGGVPREYEGRAYEWHKKVQQFAAGGGIKPAAYIDGNEFVEAAQAYGLKTDNATLNKIVDRVNKGESVREAAKNVAESHAAGGEIFNTVPDMKDGGQIIDGPAYKKGGKVDKDDEGAAFGVFPQMKGKRSKQDREAAKNVPVDLARGVVSGVLGAPGDIESLLRIPYDYLRSPTMSELVTEDKTSKTLLPTSEDIEKRLPFRSEAPVSKAASGLGILGGGFYTGRGSPLRVIGALPSAIKHGAQEFAKASVAGVPHVVKPKGGNWMGNLIDPSLDRLKSMTGANNDPAETLRQMYERYTPEAIEALPIARRGIVHASMDQLKRDIALNKWVSGNLSNYVKKEMGTPEDPVRRLAEEGVSHLPKDLQNPERMWTPEELAFDRKRQGFPEEGVAKQPTAQMWEQMADQAIYPTKAGDIQRFHIEMAKRDEAVAKYEEHLKKLDENLVPYLKSKGLNDTQVEGMMRLPDSEKANILNDKTLNKLFRKIPPTPPNMQFLEEASKTNPWISKVDPDVPVYSGNVGGLNFEHIIDVLKQDIDAGRIRPEQLNKVSMEQAVRRTAEYDQEMAKKMAETQLKNQSGFPLLKEYPEGYRWIELAKPKITVDTPLPEGFRWLEPKGGYERLEGPSLLDPQRTRTYLGDTKEQALKVAEERSMLGSEQHKMLEDALKYEGSTMGHCVGGYCPDVLSGRTKIFSLRDAKGEPHVTVEVRPQNEKGYYNSLDPEGRKELLSKATEYRRQIDPNWNEAANSTERAELLRDYLTAQNVEIPSEIVQIKGKQNAKPKEDYLPFVQDFVRSGNWSEVGDFKNTGFDWRTTGPQGIFMADDVKALEQAGYKVPKYLTSAEKDDLARKLYEMQTGNNFDTGLPKAPPPIEGMAKGGKAVKEVVELGIDEIKALLGMAKKAPKGVDPIVVKPSERAAAGRKAAELIKSQPQIKASEALGRMKEKGFKKTTTTQADRTRVGGGNIGGAPFSAISEADPLYAGKVWGVMDEGTASRLINLTDPETAWTTMLGSADQLKTNPIVFDKLKKQFLESMKAGNLSPELEAKINHNLALNFGEGAQIRDPSIWKEADTFEKRAALADLMMGQGIPPSKGGLALGGEKSGKGVIFRPTDTLIRETEPYLLHSEHGGDVPTFAAGPRLFSLDKSSTYRPDLHPGFPTLIEGKDLGVNMLPTPTEIYLPDWHRAFKQKKPERFHGPWAEDIIARRKSGSYKLGGAEGPGYYDLALGLKNEGLPSQDLTDDYIRHLIREGFKAGGAVGGLSRVTKSCDCHD